MWNFFLILCALLLVEGVSGDETIKVSVIEGDSVTLKPDDGEIQTGDKILWKFNDSIITSDDALKRFRDGLNDQSGSLTIKNIRTTDSGLFELKIRKSSGVKTNIYIVTVSDVVESVSVTEGDTVTLHTGVNDKQSGDVIQWKFGDQDLNGPGDTMSNIDVNKETGDLTISNIRRDQTGDYKVEIKTSSMISHRKFNITVSGEMETVSVREGETIILSTGLHEKQGYDPILWKFGDRPIANRLLPHGSIDERFKGRLQLDRESGSLIIHNFRSTDSGDYHLDMSSSTYSIQRSISLTVSGSGQSSAVSGISGASVGLIVWAVTVLFLQV